MTTALYRRDGEHFVPSELTRGPWRPDAQHGGPPSALLVRAIARHEDGERMFITRLTVELLRPIPLAPVTVSTTFERPGKRVQLVRASLAVDGVEVARATALRMRRAQLTLPKLPATAMAPPHHSQGRPRTDDMFRYDDLPSFAYDGVDHRIVAGGFDIPGPATDWMRLRQPLVEGEPTSPLCRAVAAADFGNGLSSALPPSEGYSFINPDLTVYFHREPVGEWICLAAESHLSPIGVGVAESRLWDEAGAFGRSLQSLLVAHEPTR
jgi:hypothetical protein